jgi:hypothetical protein
MREYPLITPKFEREWDNAPGPFYVVKDQCILCALPPETAPQNITWTWGLQWLSEPLNSQL